jgi:hypothetical protein
LPRSLYRLALQPSILGNGLTQTGQYNQASDKAAKGSPAPLTVDSNAEVAMSPAEVARKLLRRNVSLWRRPTRAMVLFIALPMVKPGLLWASKWKGMRLFTSNSKHLGSANRADALSSWFAILHRYGLSILHFFLGTTFYTIGLHLFSSY